MMTDESVLEWARGWLRDNPPDDPTFQQRFIDGLSHELKVRRERESEWKTVGLSILRDGLHGGHRDAITALLWGQRGPAPELGGG